VRPSFTTAHKKTAHAGYNWIPNIFGLEGFQDLDLLQGITTAAHAPMLRAGTNRFGDGLPRHGSGPVSGLDSRPVGFCLPKMDGQAPSTTPRIDNPHLELGLCVLLPAPNTAPSGLPTTPRSTQIALPDIATSMVVATCLPI